MHPWFIEPVRRGCHRLGRSGLLLFDDPFRVRLFASSGNHDDREVEAPWRSNAARRRRARAIQKQVIPPMLLDNFGDHHCYQAVGRLRLDLLMCIRRRGCRIFV